MHASYHRDASRHLGAEAVAALDDRAWTPLDGRSLSLGFTRDAVWLRFDVGYAAGKPADDKHLLVVNNSLLSDVQLYAHTSAGEWVELASWAVLTGSPTRYPTFELHNAKSGITAYLLRIESTPSVASTFSVWQEKAWMTRANNQDFLVGVAYGGYLLLIVLYAAFASWTRERLHLAYTLYITANLSVALLVSGWPRVLWPEVDNGVWSAILGASIAMSILLGCWFAVLMLQVDKRWPLLGKRLLWASGAVAAVGVLGSAGGFYIEVMPWIQGYLVALMALGMVISVVLAARGDAPGRLFLLAFGLYMVGVLARVLRNYLSLDFYAWIDQLYQAGTFMHMLVMSVGIFTTYSRLKAEAQAAQTRLEAQEKLRVEQRDFLTLVSHELRNPMAIISASTDNMACDPSLSEPVKNRVKKIQRATQRIQELMAQFLSNERLLQDSHKLKHSQHEMRALCKSAANDLPEQAWPTLAWKNGSPITLQCDGELVKVAVYNLMINAWRHSPAGTPIEVSISEKQGLCTVEVADRGPGIPADEHQHLFKRFYRGNQSVDKPGTGLGLYLVKTIAERHGGHVSASARAGGGTVFSLTLPLQQSPARISP